MTVQYVSPRVEQYKQKDCHVCNKKLETSILLYNHYTMHSNDQPSSDFSGRFAALIATHDMQSMRVLSAVTQLLINCEGIFKFAPFMSVCFNSHPFIENSNREQ